MDTHPLRSYRDAHGLTQKALGAKLGVPRETVARWEVGLRRIDRELLPAVSEKTGIPKRRLRPDLAELLTEDAQ